MEAGIHIWEVVNFHIAVDDFPYLLCDMLYVVCFVIVTIIINQFGEQDVCTAQ